MAEFEQRIIFIRHPETVANVGGFFSGRLDVDLTETGEAQAEAAVDAMAILHPDRVWTSPLTRCRKIADPLCEQLGYEPVVEPLLIEMDFGALEGEKFTTAFAEHQFPWPTDDAGHEHPAQGAESFELVAARAEAVLQKLKDVEGTTLCVTHGGFMRMLFAVFTQGDARACWNVHLMNCATITLAARHMGDTLSMNGFNLSPDEFVTRMIHTSLHDTLFEGRGFEPNAR